MEYGFEHCHHEVMLNQVVICFFFIFLNSEESQERPQQDQFVQ